jgi:hypothetical protein
MNILIFLIFRFLFFFFINFKYSIVFRAFSLFGYLFLMFLEGNVSYFAYLFVSDLSLFYSLEWKHSALNFLTLLLIFIYSFFLICNNFIFLIFYKKLSRYLFINVHPIFKGATFLTVCMIKNSFIGIMNSLLQDDFKTQISYLILLEGIYLGIIMCVFLPLRIYHSKTKTFILLIVSIVKIILMLSLYTDKN